MLWPRDSPFHSGGESIQDGELGHFLCCSQKVIYADAAVEPMIIYSRILVTLQWAPYCKK